MPNAIALSPTELPIQPHQLFASQHAIFNVIRDALPDAWGQRLLAYRYPGKPLSLIEMLLYSSSDRIGALHFQDSGSPFIPRHENHASLDELQEVAILIEQGKAIPKTLLAALAHGTSIGGARPKALINTDNKKYIAKFSASTDLFPIVQAEFATMWLANKIGLTTAPVKLVKASKKYVLLVERFDRHLIENDWGRKFMVSALTLLGLDEMEGRYASYLELADLIRQRGKNSSADLKALFRRMIFNICVGNTDDHAKNHAFYWDGKDYALTPAYDICPYPRMGQQATQAMVIGKEGAFSTLKNAKSGAAWFQLTAKEALIEITQIVEGIKQHWAEARELAELSEIQSNQLMGTAILNPYCFYESV